MFGPDKKKDTWPPIIAGENKVVGKDDPNYQVGQVMYKRFQMLFELITNDNCRGCIFSEIQQCEGS